MFCRSLVIAIGLAAVPLACASATKAPQSCAAADLHATLIAPAEIERTLTSAPGVPSGHVSNASGYLVRGPCAAKIRAYRLGNALLRDGRIIPVSEHADPPRQNRTFDEAELITSAADAPSLVGERFIMALRVGYRQTPQGLARTFLGIWNKGSESVISAFTRLPDGRLTRPVPVLRSKLPVRSLRYLPAPDTNAGRVDLVQEGRNGEVRLIAFDLQAARSG